MAIEPTPLLSARSIAQSAMIVECEWFIYTDRSYIHRYKYINNILIFLVGLLGSTQNGGGTEHPRVSGRKHVIQTINPEIHFQREQSSQGPDPPVFSNFS